MNLADVFEFLSRQRHKILMDMQIYLPFHLRAVSAQKVKIRKKSAGSRVFHRHHSSIGPPLRKSLEKAFEGSTFYNVRVNAFVFTIVTACSLLVKTSVESLYCYCLVHTT